MFLMRVTFSASLTNNGLDCQLYHVQVRKIVVASMLSCEVTNVKPGAPMPL
jgi:hypothetical protein